MRTFCLYSENRRRVTIDLQSLMNLISTEQRSIIHLLDQVENFKEKTISQHSRDKFLLVCLASKNSLENKVENL